MAERLKDRLLEYLQQAQGKVVHLRDLRMALQIEPGSRDDTNLRTQMSTTMVEQKIVSPSGKNDGVYKVIKPVHPIPVFSVPRERRPVFELVFPRDFETMMEMDFANHAVLREGDLITIGGVKSKGKTHLCLNICGENIDRHPFLMGNEYSVFIDGHYEPAPRFLERLDIMDVRNGGWIEWVDENGNDKFTLLPVKEDYAEHIVKDQINIIDWINQDADRLYDISKVLENIKAAVGRGIVIVALQKKEGASNPRGDQFVRDFSDMEIILDGFGSNTDDVLLTIRGVKEKTAPIIGKTYAYTIIGKGTKTINFREVKQCPACHGNKYVRGSECAQCSGKGYIG